MIWKFIRKPTGGDYSKQMFEDAIEMIKTGCKNSY